MILDTEELLEAVKIQLAVKLNTEIEIVALTHMKIYFYLKSSDDKWVEGYVQVDYNTDLAIYIARPERHGGGYSYQGDILWCDILPEGVE